MKYTVIIGMEGDFPRSPDWDTYVVSWETYRKIRDELKRENKI